ncbi:MULTISPECIES: iron-containing alcohol dehydrogenase [Burkholderia cepacia complex]|uniref:iron-containing alcohol dehydrogenase n=1 Tax=Burkholderia cepacia complex TaxID=87882 RepID=UPI000F09461C|nr:MULTISPECIES: iron-containing alcohol dehydrogenase [Burkholderia cepacia complex]AYQ44185.1 alcohol dehydrogenase [Burkholderia lata]
MEMSPQSMLFETVPSILQEWGCVRRLGQVMAAWTERRHVLIVTDAGLHNAGVLEPAKASLAAEGFRVAVFDEVVADPPESVVSRCVEFARSAEAGIVIGLGGGSSMDIAKLAAVLVVSRQSLAEMYGIGNVQGARLPLVQIPTTAGTGSEVTNISIVSVNETTKMGIVARQLYADKVILDAELTVGLPRSHTAATGIDAMVHAIEAYTSKHKKNAISDALAREALRLLVSNLIPACENGEDRHAREAMLLGATLAGQAFANAPVAAVHALAYPLGGHFHIPHGLSNALMLAPVLRFNAEAAASHYAELADVVGAGGTGDATERTAAFIAFMEDLMDRSGAPRRLRDVGVTHASLPTLAADAMKQQRLLLNNPVVVTESDALRLFEQAY